MQKTPIIITFAEYLRKKPESPPKNISMKHCQTPIPFFDWERQTCYNTRISVLAAEVNIHDKDPGY